MVQRLSGPLTGVRLASDAVSYNAFLRCCPFFIEMWSVYILLSLKSPERTSGGIVGILCITI